jgi:hypothetical protein
MMGLQGMVAAAFNGATARLQRTVIAYATCAVAGVGALIMATGASVLALEPYVGEIYARLIVAAVFVLVVLSTILWLQRAKHRHPLIAPVAAAAPPEPVQRQAQFAQLAMIVEAVLLGYALSRRSDRR